MQRGDTTRGGPWPLRDGRLHSRRARHCRRPRAVCRPWYMRFRASRVRTVISSHTRFTIRVGVYMI